MDATGAYAPALCEAAAPGCAFQAETASCVTTSALARQLLGLRPADVGTCAAACYVRVLASCPAAAGSPAPAALAASSKACWAARGCTWVGGVCEPDLYGSKLGPWGLAATRAWETCRREGEAWGCAAAGAKRAAPLPQRVAAGALARPMVGSGVSDARCAV